MSDAVTTTTSQEYTEAGVSASPSSLTVMVEGLSPFTNYKFFVTGAVVGVAGGASGDVPAARTTGGVDSRPSAVVTAKTLMVGQRRRLWC